MVVSMGRNAAENGPARATRHFTVPETTARRLKYEDLQKLKAMQHAENTIALMKSLHMKPQGRPPFSLAGICDVISLGDQNPPNLKTAKCEQI